MAKAPVDRLLPNRQTKSGSSSQSHKWKCKRRRWPSNPKAVRSIAPLPDRSTRPGSSSQRHIMSRASARRHQTGCTSRACRKSRIKNQSRSRSKSRSRTPSLLLLAKSTLSNFHYRREPHKQLVDQEHKREYTDCGNFHKCVSHHSAVSAKAPAFFHVGHVPKAR